MRKFIEVCGWGYVVVMSALVLLQTIGAAALTVSLYGWFQGDCDWAAYLGMALGIAAMLFGGFKFDTIKNEARGLLKDEEEI